MDFVTLIIGYLIGFLEYGKGKEREKSNVNERAGVQMHTRSFN
jgi:hypothetical protein